MKILWIHWRWTNLNRSSTSWHKRQIDLEKRWLSIDIPQFDNSVDPSYESWAKKIDTLDINRYNIILTSSHWWWVIIKYLLENKIKLKRLVMVCPWRSYSKKENTWKLYDFLDKNEINLKPLINEIIVINSKDDQIVNPKNWEILAQKVWAKFIQLDWYWHKMHWKAIKIINDLVINWIK